MQQVLDLEGEVVDRQTFLDGTRELTIEAQSAAGAAEGGGWLLTLSFRWLAEIDASIEEGDLTLTDGEGSGLYAVVTGGSAEAVYDDDLADEVTLLALAGEVRSGEGRYAGWDGTIRISGRLTGDAVRLESVADLAGPTD